MNYTYYLGQLFGLLAFISLWFSFKENRKEHILKYQIYSNSFCALQYLCVQAYTGLLLHFMCLVRNFIYYRYDNKDIPIKWLYICVFFMIFMSILSYESIYSLLPMIGIVLNSWGLWQNNLKIQRLCEATAAFTVTVYSLIVLAYGGALANGFEFLMTLIAIYKFDIKRSDIIESKRNNHKQ